MEATRSLLELLAKADETRSLYEKLRLPMPDPLRRLLGSNSNGAHGSSMNGSFAMDSPVPPMPPEADSDWAWVKLVDCSPHTLAKAILRQSPEPLRSKELYERVAGYGLSVSLGTVSNAATRLQTYGVFTRDLEGRWHMAKPDEAGVIHEGYLWGPKETFAPQELAAHRRQAIIFILSKTAGGLQMAQITAQLRAVDWLRAEVNKDLTKGDVEKLVGEGKIRRMPGYSKKYQMSQLEV